MKNELLRISFSEPDFSSQEIKEITESFSKIVPIETSDYIRKADGTTLPTLLIFVLGFISGAVATGFFQSMGSDFYEEAKKKVAKILKNKRDPTVIFEMSCEDTDIRVESRTKDEEELNQVFDTIDKARDIAIKELNKKETPKMSQITINYHNGWILDSGRYWKPPKHMKLYKYSKKSQKWELTDDWSEK